MIKKLFFALIVLCGTRTATGVEQPGSLPYTRQILQHNLAPLWHNTRLHFPESSQQWEDFPEPLGFIGDNYQRFNIHYTAIIKDARNPYRYNVAGKTRVKSNICRFTGTITVMEARLNREKNPEYPQYAEGEVQCRIDLWEDKSQAGSGHIQGKLITYWFLDNKKQVQYNTLDAVSDGFANNQCTAIWTSYQGGITKHCNWGDFRIPESGSLDVGAGEFYVDKKYAPNGWQYYNQAIMAEEENKAGGKALADEKRKWWQ